MRKAFTMVELVLVVAIVVIISTALLSTFITCMALNDNSRMMTTAMNIARDKIEDMVNRSKTDWEYVVSTPYNEAALKVAYNFKGSYSCAIDVYSPIGISNLKFARVVVCWKLKNGRVAGYDDGSGGGGQLDGIRNGSERFVIWNTISVLDSPVVLTTAILRS